jgi:hypothetical protein
MDCRRAHACVCRGDMERGNSERVAGSGDMCHACRGDTPGERLEAALDALCGRKVPFYGQYRLFSAVERRVGGQGIVQFAQIGQSSAMVRSCLLPARTCDAPCVHIMRTLARAAPWCAAACPLLVLVTHHACGHMSEHCILA